MAKKSFNRKPRRSSRVRPQCWLLPVLVFCLVRCAPSLEPLQPLPPLSPSTSATSSEGILRVHHHRIAHARSLLERVWLHTYSTSQTQEALAQLATARAQLVTVLRDYAVELETRVEPSTSRDITAFLTWSEAALLAGGRHAKTGKTIAITSSYLAPRIFPATTAIIEAICEDALKCIPYFPLLTVPASVGIIADIPFFFVGGWWIAGETKYEHQLLGADGWLLSELQPRLAAAASRLTIVDLLDAPKLQTIEPLRQHVWSKLPLRCGEACVKRAKRNGYVVRYGPTQIDTIEEQAAIAQAKASNLALEHITGVAIDPQGRIFITAVGQPQIFVIQNGHGRVFAGSSSRGYQDGVAEQAQLHRPTALAWMADVGLLFVDDGHIRVVREGIVSHWERWPDQQKVQSISSDDGSRLWVISDDTVYLIVGSGPVTRMMGPQCGVHVRQWIRGIGSGVYDVQPVGDELLMYASGIVWQVSELTPCRSSQP